ncbi:flagellar protein FlaG [Halothiobacillus sp. DCM-1]|uniref:flagellar protein FlaG n=1 Tax=Halothiobacillus sp. DCM-1 TaxID=3112558 RepID=UPI003245A9B0
MSGISPVSISNIPPAAGRDVLSSLPPNPVGSAPVSVPVVEGAPLPSRAAKPESVSPTPSKSEINQALEDMIKRGQPANTSVQFSVDEKLDQVVIKVVDPQTNKVIKQFPAEAILKMREEMLAMDSKTPPAGSLLSEKT